MKNIKTRTRWLVIALGVILVLSAPVFAQDTLHHFPLAYVSSDGVWVSAADLPAPVHIAAEGTYRDFRNLVWSPDGNMLAFTALDLRNNTVLLISNREGTPPVPLVPKLKNSLMPISFGPDGRLLYAMQTDTILEAGGLYGPVFELHAIAATSWSCSILPRTRSPRSPSYCQTLPIPSSTRWPGARRVAERSFTACGMRAAIT